MDLGARAALAGFRLGRRKREGLAAGLAAIFLDALRKKGAGSRSQARLSHVRPPMTKVKAPIRSAPPAPFPVFGALGLERPEAQQACAMHLQPFFGAVDMVRELGNHAPEGRRMVHVDEMRHFVRGEIIEHVARRHDEAPGKIQGAGRGAGSPAARRTAQAHLARLDAELGRVTAHRGFEIAARFADEEILHAPRDMGRVRPDAEKRQPGVRQPLVDRFDPDVAALSRTLDDTMIDAPDRHDFARAEGSWRRQALETCANPARMSLDEGACAGNRGARRHREHNVTGGSAYAQGEAPRSGDALQSDPIGLSGMRDIEKGNLRYSRCVLSRQVRHATNLAAAGLSRHRIEGASGRDFTAATLIIDRSGPTATFKLDRWGRRSGMPGRQTRQKGATAA